MLLAMAELGLFAVALPARYAQLAAPDQAVRAELTVLGLSPGRYAFSQVAFDTIFVVVFATIGGLIFLRKPGDPVALLVALMLVTWGPGNDIMVLTPGALLPPEPLTWWHWPFVLIEYVAFMSWMLFFYLFPSGRFVPRGARWLAVGWIVFAGLWNFFGATPLAPLHGPKPLFAVAIAVLWGSFPVCQVYRYRHASDAVQRQQTKWVVFGVAVAVVGFLLTLVAVGPPPVDLPQEQVGRGLVSMLLMDLFVLAIPVSIGVAVLKYRLFDIDRIINRTLVYGLLTAILGLGYIGAVLVLSQVLGQDRSNLAVAGSTLAVAALFQPARRRIQTAVDRRFNGAAMAPPRPSRRSPAASASRSTSISSPASCWRSLTRPWNRPGSRCGFDLPHTALRAQLPGRHGQLPGPTEPAIRASGRCQQGLPKCQNTSATGH
jgi:hypothetical protein